MAFLLGALLTGSAIGFAAGRTTVGGASGGEASVTTSTYSTMVRELAVDLNLSDEQTAAVDSILKWRKVRYSEVMVPLRPALDAARDSARTLIKQRLNAEQRVAFAELLNRMSAPEADSAKDAPKER